MEKIDRELLIKEISSRLPYGVKAQVLGWDEEKGEVEVPLRIYSINTDGYVYFESNDYDVDYVAIDNCLLYLRPLSSMTEEEHKEIRNKFGDCNAVEPGVGSSPWYNHPERDLKNVQFYLRRVPDIVDWLNQHHFDYRGLIEKGLALPAPPDMYKID